MLGVRGGGLRLVLMMNDEFESCEYAHFICYKRIFVIIGGGRQQQQ